MNGHPRTGVLREIPPEWDWLMRVAAALGYGEARVVFQSGLPVRIDSAVKQIKLDNEQDFSDQLKTIPLA